MNSTLVLLFVAVCIATVVAPPPPRGGPAGPGHHPDCPDECMEQKLIISEEMKTAFNECRNKSTTATNSSVPRGRLSMGSRACDIVCKAQGVGLLDKDGKPVSKEAVAEFVTKMYPTAARTSVAGNITACAVKHGATLMIKEGDCGSYKLLFNCVIRSVRKICDAEPALF